MAYVWDTITISRTTGIAIQPQDVQILSGARAEFFVEMDEPDQYQYLWEYSPSGQFFVPISGAFTYASGLNNDTLILDPVPISAHGFKYRCRLQPDSCAYTYSEPALQTMLDLELTGSKGCTLKIVPVPAGSKFRVEGLVAPAEAAIYSAHGAVVAEVRITGSSDEVGVAYLPAGYYYLYFPEFGYAVKFVKN